MSILAWIVLGLLAGFVGSKLVNKTGEGVVLDVVLGIVGAVVGGFLRFANKLSKAGSTRSMISGTCGFQEVRRCG